MVCKNIVLCTSFYKCIFVKRYVLENVMFTCLLSNIVGFEGELRSGIKLDILGGIELLIK